MSIHLVKLCVGATSIADLADWQTDCQTRCRTAGIKPEVMHFTRQTPKRAEEIVKDGSIYWVIKGAIRVRQRVLALRPTARDGIPVCAIVVDPRIVPTVPFVRTPFQGWRYLRPEDAPPDLEKVGGDLPDDLKIELARLGLL